MKEVGLLTVSALFMPLFTRVRGIGILRTSPLVRSRNFRFTEFYEVRVRHPHNLDPIEPEKGR